MRNREHWRETGLAQRQRHVNLRRGEGRVEEPADLHLGVRLGGWVGGWVRG